jgi:hypothetical protein
MVTAQEIQAGILLITRASDLLKKAKELSDKTQNLEIKEIIVELRSTLVETKNLLVETKSEVVNLKEENDALKARIKVLEQSAINSDKPILRDGLYYSQDGDGPFCTVCYDKSKQFIRVTDSTGASSFFGDYICQSCHSFFTK